MRGPILFIESLEAKDIRDPKDYRATVSLNWQKAEFYVKRYHKIIWDQFDSEKKDEMQRKSDIRLLKVQDSFPVCEKSCNVCKLTRENYRKMLDPCVLMCNCPNVQFLSFD